MKYKHHEESLKKLIEYFTTASENKDHIIAIVFGGSVAKGLERPDSDLDCMIVLTDERYNKLVKENRTCECISGYCTYEGGYFDTKYYNKQFLIDVAEKGSEPARNAFLKSRCIYTIDDEIPGMVERIPVFQKQEKEDKMLSFYSALCMNTGYFWDMSRQPEEIFLRTKTVAEIVMYGLRLLLEEKEVLFPCPKSLYTAVGRLEDKPEGILEKADFLLRNIYSEDAKNDFENTLLDFLDYEPPADSAITFTRYVEDNELWWRNPRPLVGEW